MSTAGAGSIGGGVTGGLGLSDDSGPLQGFHTTASLHHLGYDFVRHGLSLLGGGGIEYFYQSTEAPLGFRVGMEGALGLIAPEDDRAPLFYVAPAGLSFGGRYAFDEEREFRFIELGALLSAGIGLEDEQGRRSPDAFVGLIGLSVGWMRVHSFNP
jgi:hypothetical protein